MEREIDVDHLSIYKDAFTLTLVCFGEEDANPRHKSSLKLPD